MEYLVIYNEDKMKGFEDLNEVSGFCSEIIYSDRRSFCKENDLDIEEQSYERLDEIDIMCEQHIEVYKIKDLLNTITNMNIDTDEKNRLKYLLKSNNIEGSVYNYDYLQDVLDNTDEIYI